jgi:GAF domain-containing protein
MTLSCEQLQDRLLALHRANLELIKDVSLDTLLERIATVASEQADAQYAALVTFDDEGNVANFVSVGMDDALTKNITMQPKKTGLLNALKDTNDPIRLSSAAKNLNQVRFPERHPAVRSFLGVPILSTNRQLGQIYLTNKRKAETFSEEDEQIMQMLAGYAAAAIQNARLYGNLRERDIALTQRSEDWLC